MRALSIISIIALIATIFATGPGRVYACSCAGLVKDDTSNQRLLNGADAVAVGVVQEIHHDPDGYATARVRMERGYRGDLGSDFQVRADERGSCGIQLQKRERYVLLMYYKGAQLSTNLCGVVPFSNSNGYSNGYAADVVAALDRLVPNPVIADNDTSLRTPTNILLALTLALIATTAAGVAIYRRHRSRPAP